MWHFQRIDIRDFRKKNVTSKKDWRENKVENAKIQIIRVSLNSIGILKENFTTYIKFY